MYMYNKVNQTSIYDDWAATFNVKCSCGRGTTPVYFCNVETCPDHDQLFFCSNCALEDEKHDHKKKVSIKKELEERMTEWQQLVESNKNLKQILDKHYNQHQPLIKYLDNENFLKVDLLTPSPSHAVS